MLDYLAPKTFNLNFKLSEDTTANLFDVFVSVEKGSAIIRYQLAELIKKVS